MVRGTEIWQEAIPLSCAVPDKTPYSQWIPGYGASAEGDWAIATDV